MSPDRTQTVLADRAIHVPHDGSSRSSMSVTRGFVTKHKWLWPLLAAVTLAVVGWNVRATVEASMKSLLTDKVNAILDADLAALNTWLSTQKQAAEAFAYDPIMRQHITELLNIADNHVADSSPLVDSEPAKQIRNYLGPYMELIGFDGYIVTDSSGMIVAASHPELVGKRGLAGYDQFIPQVLEGTSLVSRPFRSTAVLTDSSGRQSASQPTMFTAAPVQDAGSGEVRAAIGLRIDPQGAFTAMLRAARAGETGETYAFDERGVLLSDSRFDEQLREIGLVPDQVGATAILGIEIRDPLVDMTRGHRPTTPRAEQPLTLMAASAIRGQRGVNVDGYNDYRGVPVIGAWTWLSDYGFGVATEVDVAEAYKPVYVLRAAFAVLFALLCASSLAVVAAMVSISRFRQIAARESRKARKLGQYQLDEKIGEGAMGEVYRAHHALLSRPTAVKLLKSERNDSIGIARFEREAQLSSQLTHPNTIQIYDFGRTNDGTFYYAMEHIDGLSLNRLLELEGPLAPRRAIHILKQICGSLAEAHSIGLIHRDIKPANIMLTNRGGVADQAKMLDFGLVKDISQTHLPAVTQENVIAGTPLYLSPEATKGTDHIDCRSDIYSLGVVAYEMLTGETPFVGDSAIEICLQHASRPAPPLSDSVPVPVPTQLSTLILRCLAKSPDDRPQTAQQLLRQLSEIEGEIGNWTEDEARTWWSGFKSCL